MSTFKKKKINSSSPEYKGTFNTVNCLSSARKRKRKAFIFLFTASFRVSVFGPYLGMLFAKQCRRGSLRGSQYFHRQRKLLPQLQISPL